MKSSRNRTHILLIVAMGISIGVGVLFWISRTTTISDVKKTPLCKDCNIVLLTIDTCSAKNMPCYGYDRDTTPNLCAFAQKNQLFLNSYANATWTLPSHVSIMTGLLPSTHKVNEQWVDSLSQSIPFLPEVLQQNGYETVLFQDKNSSALPSTIYSRGASEVIDVYLVDEVFKRIEEANNRHKKLFVTYYDSNCHEPNLIGSEKKLFTADSYPELPLDKSDWRIFSPEFHAYLMKKMPENIQHASFGAETDEMKRLYEEMSLAVTYDKAKDIFLDRTRMMPEESVDNLYWSYFYETYIDPRNQKMMDYLRALYDQKLVGLDKTIITNFISDLAASPYKDNTIVVITAQHGQEFGEHGIFGHSTLYEGNARVPFIMYVPGVSSHNSTVPVQSIDIMPTLLDLVGIRHSYTFDGFSLVPVLRNIPVPNRILISDDISGFKKSLRKGDWKLLVTVNSHELIPYELYNTDIDPNETHNLLESNMDMAKTIIKESNAQRVSRK